VSTDIGNVRLGVGTIRDMKLIGLLVYGPDPVICGRVALGSTAQKIDKDARAGEQAGRTHGP
jgi:hypothetical protein